jgi:hypothetical protein
LPGNTICLLQRFTDGIATGNFQSSLPESVKSFLWMKQNLEGLPERVRRKVVMDEIAILMRKVFLKKQYVELLQEEIRKLEDRIELLRISNKTQNENVDGLSPQV